MPTRSRQATPDPITLEITRLHPGGDGLAEWQGQALRVPGTIPGELVEVMPRGRGAADLVAIARPSPHRVVPACRHFGPCGGCTWQHIAYPEQLRWKRELLQDLLDAALGRRAPRVLPPLATPSQTPDGMPWGYRHKVHFVFGPAKAGPYDRAGSNAGRDDPTLAGAGPGDRTRDDHRPRRAASVGAGFSRPDRGASLVMGHFMRGSREIVPVVECPVHAEAGNQLAFAVRDRLIAARVPGTDPETTRGVARHIIVRVGRHSGERVATLVVTREDVKALRAVSKAIIEDEAPDGWNLNVHDGANPFLFGRTTRHLHGRERLREQMAGVSFLVSPTAFFQTNVDAAEQMVRTVLDHLVDRPRARVLDLYAGAGLFSLPLARTGRRVVAVEENRTAVEDGRASQRLSQISEDACRFVARRVEEVLADLARERDGLGRRFDAAVLDPPRQGCAPEVLAALTGAPAIERLIYVSCDPASLARDLRALVDGGYRIDSIQPVDMFPHTAHIESVTRLERI